MSLLLKIWKVLRLPTNMQLFFMRRFNDQFLIGVTGIFLDEHKRIFLVKHTYRGGETWSLPGGYVKGKEHPKEALEREIKEETGLVVSADRRLQLRTDRNSARLDIVYSGKFIGGNFEPSDEVKDHGLYKFSDLPRLTKDQLYFIDKVLNSD